MITKTKEICKAIKGKLVIPKGIYCYTFKRGKQCTCPYWHELEEKDEWGENKYYCGYLDLKDEYMGETLLWDMCKECGVNCSFWKQERA